MQYSCGTSGIKVKPEFVDNRELTLAHALCAHMDWLHGNYKHPVELSIATGFFKVEAGH